MTRSKSGKWRAVPGGAADRFWRILLLLTAAGFLVRLTRLGAQSIWVDEGMSIRWIENIETYGWQSLLENFQGPLHAILLYLVSRISMNEWWLRLPSALAGTLAIPAVAYLGRQLWGARVGLLAALLMTVSPFALYYAQEVRNYALTLLFASLTITAAWHFVQKPSLRAAASFTVLELLGIASNLNGVFLALGLNLWVGLSLPWGRRELTSWLGTQILAVAILSPYAVLLNRQVRPERLVGIETEIDAAEPLRGKTTLHPMSLPYTAYAFSAGYSLGPTLEELRADHGAAAQPRHLPALLLVLVGFGLPLIAGLTDRAAWSMGTPFIVASATVIGFTVWLAAANMKPFNVRYLSVLFPVFLCFVARGMWRLPGSWRRLTLITALLVSVWSCFNYLFVPRYGRDDTRGVVQYLRERAASHDLVLHLSLSFPLGYYDELEQTVQIIPIWDEVSLDAARVLRTLLLDTGTTVWYLESRPETLDPHGHLRHALAERAAVSETVKFVGIKVHRFELSSLMDKAPALPQ